MFNPQRTAKGEIKTLLLNRQYSLENLPFRDSQFLAQGTDKTSREITFYHFCF